MLDSIGFAQTCFRVVQRNALVSFGILGNQSLAAAKTQVVADADVGAVVLERVLQLGPKKQVENVFFVNYLACKNPCSPLCQDARSAEALVKRARYDGCSQVGARRKSAQLGIYNLRQVVD